ncbi:S8 family serine peptidase [uncultured Mucilaginibacter sp.]|uniref:S8 family serine peptidase n=1 Tax=uncultured Mucilaginibacter sp. TaxID=797541 RepID=UPI0025CFC3A4|nr:S8 family serine peptidase [uncultured Mucilaginibacter sp.]
MHRSKFHKSFWAGIITLLWAVNVLAQKPLVTAEKKAQLDQLAVQIQETYAAGLQKALLQAPQRNWVTRRTSKDGTEIALQRINTLGFPVFYKTYSNVIAAATTRTNSIQTGGDLGLNLSGSSTALNGKLAIWDGGSVLTTHQEFSGKAINLRNPTATVSQHSTHVAGTMIARGVYSPAKGMAFGANTLQSYDFNSDIAEITAAASGLLLSNHSYGTIAGWNYNDDEARWEWYGLPGDNEDYKFGFYDSESRALDQVAVNAPYYLIVSASGNNRSYNGPAVGSNYYGFTSRTDPTMISKGPRPANISSNNGYDIIPGFSNAKNVLTVGAINQLPYGPSSRQGVSVTSFSSIGPTDDGRIKPDVCGDGDQVLSTGNSSNTSYVTLSGTSMATPNVTGSLYLLQEYYAQKNSGSFMRSATLKGLVCHTAFDAGNVGPDYTFGWGVLDARKAAQAITDKGTKSQISERTLQQGQTENITVVASGNGPLIATIAWTDPQATVAADGTLNDRTPKLVNDLDIRISDGTTIYSPWVLNWLAPANAATRGDNVRDNVEQVYLDNAIPGKTYTIRVTHKGTLQIGNQPYSIIVTGVGGTAYCASAPTSNADSRINNVTLSNINNTPAAGCTTYSDYTAQVAQLEQGVTYPLSVTLGTCGANFNKIAKVFIDWNGDGTFDPVAELAATTNVINGTAAFNGNVTVPATVVPGNYSLMRVVLVETDNPATINPCGSYNKGETQDYRVQFTGASRDVGALRVTNSSVGGGCAGVSNVSVRLKNYGTTAVGNIPVTVTITPANGGQVITFNETYTQTLAPQAEDDFVLNGTFNATAGASYTIAATTSLANDQVAINNTVTANIVIGSIPVPTNLSAIYCDDTQQYLLSGSGEGSVLWYTVPTGGTPITAGNSAFTKTAPVNNTYYAALNDYSASVGPATKYAFTGGGYNQFGQSVTVFTKIPIVIQSARLYVGNAGNISVVATNANGEEVARSNIAVTATRSVAGGGAQSDDITDQGRVYNLNLVLPQPGTYRLNVSYTNGATLYRSNAGVNGYPFGNDVFSIRGNNATLASNPSDTTAYRSFYYFFYDMKIGSNGCPSANRVPVQVSGPVITQNGATLQSNQASNNQWYLNGVIIQGATSPTFIPQQSGNYQLRNVQATGCMAVSPVYTYIKADAVVNTPTEIKLAAYPVPTATDLNVSFVAPEAADLTLSLISTQGQEVYRSKANIQAGFYNNVIRVNNFAAGTYVLRVILGQKVYSAKIIVVK